NPFARIFNTTVDMGAFERATLSGTANADAFVLTYSSLTTSGTVTVTISTNGGSATSLGTFPMNAALTIDGLGGTDSVRVVGTTGADTISVNSVNGLIVNGATLIFTSIENRTLAGAAGGDVYKFDADTALGLWTLDEAGGGIDTLDFSPTTTVGLSLNLATATTQAVHATNLSLVLGSTTTFENAVGGSGADTLTGNGLGNSLSGGLGDDMLNGGAGSDLLFGGANNDTYLFTTATTAEADQVTENTNEGIDSISFAALTTSVSLHLGTNATQNVHTNRTLKLNSPNTFENSIGGSGADSLAGNGSSNTLTGGLGDDTLNGGAGGDLLFGGLNNDSYVFTAATAAEADQVSENTNEGTDTISFAALTTSVSLHLGTNATQTVHSNRTLKLNSPNTFENSVGGAGADSLAGNGAVNTLTGGAGDDTLNGGAGDDLLFGGLNNDTYVFTTATAAEADQVTENTNEGTDTISFAALTTSVSLHLGSNATQNVHINRTLKLNSPNTFENSIGGSGADSLAGNGSSNTLTGGAGDDTLNGGAGSDLLFGGLNNDTYVFTTATAAEADQVTENTNEGTDTISFAALTTSVSLHLGTNAIQNVHTNRTLKLNSPNTFEKSIGGSGADSLAGNGASNTLTGGPGDDTLNGGAGGDLLLGGLNNDTYVFTTASVAEADQVTENTGEGTDTLNFSTLTTNVVLNLGLLGIQTVHTNRTLQLNSVSTLENAVGGSGRDALIGNTLANRLTGGDGDNILVGLEGTDILESGSGRDILIGGLGLDTLNGGSNDDILIAGRTTSDASVSNLNTIRTEWISGNAYATRIANLRAGVGSPAVSLKATINVLNDSGEDDALTGGTGTDWYFRAVDDVITDLINGEITDAL
ncbi:MAG: M10 family metallopeptidase C-terminal domain-containing protein, partial [Planctomycetaceae bacterium]